MRRTDTRLDFDWRCAPHVCCLDLGGDSSSSQSQQTESTDARVVADSGGIGISTRGNVHVTATDAGLVTSAFDYVKAADAAITDRNNSVLTTAENTAKAIIDAGYKVGADAVGSAANTLATIDRAAGGQTLDNSQIIAALIGAAALVFVAKGES